MKKRILAVLETEQEYADLLLRFLEERKDGLFETRIFTEEEALQAYLEEETAEVLLASEQSDYQKFEKKIPFVILLTEGCYVKEEEQRPVIYKFQSAEQILKEVLKLYLEQSEEKEVRYVSRERRSCKKIGVFSPCGGSGKTTTAVILGNLLGREKKVLLLNLEPFKKPYSWLEEEENGGVSELLYYMQQERGKLEMKIKSMVMRVGNMDYLPGVSNFLDLQKMQAGEMYECIQMIEQYTEYDVIIFDISFVSEALLSVLEECDVIYQPVRKRQEQMVWIQNFSKKQQEILKEKCREVVIPWQEESVQGNVEYLTASAVGEAVRQVLEQEKQVNYAAYL